VHRADHLDALAGECPGRLVQRFGADVGRTATALLVRPSAQPSTIRDHNASACEDLRRRVHRVSVWCSSSVNTNSAVGRPRDAMNESWHWPI
jgi:hypothetical protein